MLPCLQIGMFKLLLNNALWTENNGQCPIITIDRTFSNSTYVDLTYDYYSGAQINRSNIYNNAPNTNPSTTSTIYFNSKLQTLVEQVRNIFSLYE